MLEKVKQKVLPVMNPDSVAGDSNTVDNEDFEQKLIFNPKQFKKSLFERFDGGAP